MMSPNRPRQTTTPVKVAVGLARVSTDRQEHSIQDQNTEIKAWCTDKGHELLHVFHDEAVSGSVLDRPGIRQLFAFLEASPRKGAVVMWKRNRLARPEDPRDGVDLERRIEKLGWRLVFLQGSQPVGDPMIDAVMAIVEHHQGGEFLRGLATDVMRGLLRRVLGGGIAPGGKIPYGFAKIIVAEDGSERRVARTTKHRKLKIETSRLVPGDPSEVEAVAHIFTRYASGDTSLADLAAELNNKGVPSPCQRKTRLWTHGTLRDILLNRVYVGDMVWNKETSSKFIKLVGGRIERHSSHTSARGGKPTGYARHAAADWVVLEDHHEGLVPRSLFAQAGERLTARGAATEGAPRAHRLVYPLSGRVRCRMCTARMNGNAQHAKGYHYRRYMCASYFQNRSCETYVVDAPKLERKVLAVLQAAYVVPDLDRTALRARIVDALRRKLGGDPVEDADLKRLRREQEELEIRIRGAVQNIAVVPPEAARRLGEQIGEWSKELDESKVRAAHLEGRAARTLDFEAAADEVLGLVDELAETTKDAKPERLRQVFGRVVDSVELTFKTETVMTKAGGQRKRHTLIEGVVNGTGLLDVVQQAGCFGQKLLG